MNRRTFAALLSTSMLSGFLPSFASAQEAAVEIKDMSLGSPDAPIKMIEYASLTCSHCQEFHNTVFKDLKRDYIDAGLVHFTYREVYFDRYGLWGAMMARCAGEQRYFAVLDILFGDVMAWAGIEEAVEVAEKLKRIGLSVGMAQEEVDACFADAKMAEAMVARFDASMKEYDVTGTPTFIINGTKYSNMPYEEMKAILDPLAGRG